MIKHYILVGREVMEVPLEEWGRWFETANRHIGDDIIDGIRVSTIFLGLDMATIEVDRGPPLLFETMVFPDAYLIGRWETIDEAEAEHAKTVAVYQAIAEAITE